MQFYYLTNHVPAFVNNDVVFLSFLMAQL